MSLWIELLSPRGKVLNRSRFGTGTLRVGRGYTNDMILEEPKAGLEHLLITSTEDGSIIAQGVEGHTFHLDNRPNLVAHASLDGENIVRIGRARLRVRSSTYVPTESPKRTRQLAYSLYREALQLLTASIPLLFGILAFILNGWAWDTEGRTFGYFAVDNASILLVAVPWVAVWSLLSHTYSGNAHIRSHLLIAGIGLCAQSLLLHGFPLIPYIFGIGPLQDFAKVLRYIVWGAVIFAHLIVAIGNWRLNPGLWVGIAAMCLGTGATLQLANDKAGIQATPKLTHMAPSWLRLAKVKNQSQVMDELMSMKGEVDKAREEAMPHGL